MQHNNSIGGYRRYYSILAVTFLRMILYGVDPFKNFELLPQCDMSEKQLCRQHISDFTTGRINWMLDEGQSVTSVSEKFEIAHSLVL